MKIENGIVVGSNGKYDTKNPIGKILLSNFDKSIVSCITKFRPDTVLEIGCGEGHVTELILAQPISRLLATDVSESLICDNISKIADERVSFKVADVMTMGRNNEFDLVVCCEVLEHLADPFGAIKALREINAKGYIFSVPREPIWRMLNFARGAYFREFGNSPGHVNHYTKRRFIDLVSNEFTILYVRSPLPWTIVCCVPR